MAAAQDPLADIIAAAPPLKQRDPLDDIIASAPPIRRQVDPVESAWVREQAAPLAPSMPGWLQEQSATRKPQPIAPPPFQVPQSTVVAQPNGPLPPMPKINAVGATAPPTPAPIPGMERLGALPGVRRPEVIPPVTRPSSIERPGFSSWMAPDNNPVISDYVAAPAFIRGVTSAVGGTVGGVARALGEADFTRHGPTRGNIGTARGFGQSPGMAPLPPEPLPVDSTQNPVQGALRSVGQAASSATESVEQTFARDKSIKDFMANPQGAISDPRWWIDTTFSAVGSMAPMAAAGVGTSAAVGRIATMAPELAAAALKYGPSVAAGLTESAQVFGSTYEEARKAGIDPETARQAGALVAAGTALTSIPAHKVGIFNDGIRSIGKRIAAGSAAEGAQEGVQTWWENVVAKTFYDPQRPLLQGVPEAVVGSAIVGGALGSAGANERPSAPPPAAPDPIQEIIEAAPPIKADPVVPPVTAPPPAALPLIPPQAEVPVSAPPSPPVVDPIAEIIAAAPAIEPVPATVTTPAIVDASAQPAPQPIQQLPADTSLFSTSNEARLPPAPEPREEVVQPVPVETVAPVADTPQEYNAPLPPQTAPPAGPVEAAPDGPRTDPNTFIVPTKSLNLDPIRFQYKVEGIGRGGVGDELKGIQTWKPERAGVISVWKDPANGKDYVVNGHHRYDLASSLNVPDLRVQYIDAPDAQSARAAGALMNISEGRGTAVDAAKFMRDSGKTVADLEAEGISVKGQVAKEGAALVNLAPSIFDDVIHGNLDLKRAVIVGEGLTSFEDQKAVLKLAEQKKASNQEIREMIRLANGGRDAAPEATQVDLFGNTIDDAPNLIYETSQLSNFIRQRLSTEKKLFGLVGSKSTADRLGTAGNEIKAEANKEISDQANQALAVYDKLSERSGPIADLLREGAGRIASGERPDAVKESIYAYVRDSVAKLVGPRQPAASGAGVSATQPAAVEGGGVGVQEADRRGDTVDRSSGAPQETLVTDREARESQIAAKNDRTRPLAEVPFSLVQEEAPKPTGPDERQESMFGGKEESGAAPAFRPGTASLRPGTPSKKAASKPTKSGQMVSRQEIIDDLSAYLNGLPIRTGGFTQKAAGIFKIKEAVVRTAKPLDMPTIAHEVGHAIHKFLWGTTKKGNLNNKPLLPFKKELAPLDYDPQKQRVFEGFAEYIRLYITNPAAAQMAAPNFHLFFENKIGMAPAMEAVMHKAQERFRDWDTQPATAKIASSIKAKEREAKKWVSTINQIIVDIFDDKEAFRKAEEEFAAAGAPVQEARGAYSLMRRLGASSGRAERMVREGTFSGDPSTGYRDVGPSLLSILEPLGSRKESDYNPKWKQLEKDWGVKVVGDGLDDFRVYIFGRRMQEYIRNGMETGFTKSQVDEAVKSTETPAIKKAADQLHQFNDDVLQYAVDKGALSDKQAQAMRDKYLFYTHLDRIMDAGPSGNTNAHKMIDGGSAIMRAKGSSREIEDPLSSVLKNTYALVKWADTQEAVSALVKQGIAAESKGTILEGNISRPPKGTKFNLQEVEKEIKKILTAEGIDISKLPKDAFDAMVAIYRPNVTANKKNGEHIVHIDGEPQIFYLDEALVRALESLTPAQMGLLGKIGKVQADILRTGATGASPEFTLRNFFNDQITAAIQSQHGYIPIIDGIRGAFSVILDGIANLRPVASRPRIQSAVKKLYDSDLQSDIVKAGGKGSSFTPRGMETSQKFIASAMASTSYAKRARYTMRHPAELWAVIMDIAKAPGEFLEGATRTGEARRAKDKGATLDQIAMAYRNVSLDFGQMGAKVRPRNPYFAYLAAKLNGTRRFQQAHSRKNFARTFMKAFTYVTLPTIALWLLNKDDKEYWALEDWSRNAFWHIPTKYMGERARKIFGPFIPIPRANLYGLVYGNMVERALDKIYRKNPEAFKGATWEAFSETVPVSNVLPTAGVVPFELLLGKKIYNLAPIESAQDKQTEPKYRVRSNTSDLARALGRAANLSPLQIDHFLFGNTAGFGRAVVSNIIDPLLVAADKATGGNMGTRRNKPRPQLSDRTFFRAFSTPDSPQSAAPITKFYDELEALHQKKNAAREASKRPSGPGRGAKPLTPAEDRKLKRLEGFSKRMGKIRDQVKTVTADEAGDPDKRADQLKQLNRDLINLAQEALYKPHTYKP